MVKTAVEELIEKDTEQQITKKLVVFNDDYNSFDHVIECFVRILNHGLQQAEQCAMIIHFTGKCSVKSGSWDDLKPYCDALTDEKLDARILD